MRAAATLILLAVAGVAHAQQWVFEPRLAVSEIYTDNITLAPDGLEEDDFVTQVTPGFTLVKAEGRFTTDIEYDMESFFYSSDSDRNEIFHDLLALATAEIIRERFFLELDASAGQAVVNPEVPFSSSNVSLSGNRTEYWSAGLNPYWVQPLGSRTQARVDYRYGTVDYQNIDIAQGSQIDDFVRQEFSIEIGTIADEPGFGWWLRGDHRESEYENFGRFEFDEALVEVAIPLGGQLALVALGGKETDFPNNPTTGGLDSDRWEVGFRWRASARAQLEARTGERYFGTTYFFDWQYEARQTSIQMTYSEDPTTIGEEQLLPAIQAVAGGLPDFEIAPLTTELYTRKNFTGAVRWSGARHQVEIEGNDTKRIYLENPGTERESGLGVTWLWMLGARTRLDVGLYGGRIEFRDTDVRDDLAQINAGISRQLGRKTLIDFSVRHDQRKSNSEQQSFDYEENAAMITLLRTFGRGEVGSLSRPARRR